MRACRLHLLYSTNQYGWHRWCFDQYALPAQASVLELGCGPAHLWKTNLDRLPTGWSITLSDFSTGMLEQAQQNLGERASAFRFEVIDAQAIPFEANTFDAVIANHMLYHVPDRAQALSEMRRVLKPGGKVYLATNGLNHLRGLGRVGTALRSHDQLWVGRRVQIFLAGQRRRRSDAVLRGRAHRPL